MVTMLVLGAIHVVLVVSTADSRTERHVVINLRKCNCYFQHFCFVNKNSLIGIDLLLCAYKYCQKILTRGREF